MLGHDPVHDGQPKAGAAGLGREIGKEQSLPVGAGNPRAAINDLQRDNVSLLQESPPPLALLPPPPPPHGAPAGPGGGGRRRGRHRPPAGGGPPPAPLTAPAGGEGEPPQGD